MDFGTRQQCAEAEVGEREDYVEIFSHVTVVQQVVAVEAEENSGALDRPFAREMHAPMQVFIGAVISAAGEQGAANQSPTFQQYGADDKRNYPDCNNRGAVPPSHRNGVFVFLVNQMVGLVGFKNLVMDHGVFFEGVGKNFHALVHEETMHGPFKEGRKHNRDDKANRRPEKKGCHDF